MPTKVEKPLRRKLFAAWTFWRFPSFNLWPTMTRAGVILLPFFQSSLCFPRIEILIRGWSTISLLIASEVTLRRRRDLLSLLMSELLTLGSQKKSLCLLLGELKSVPHVFLITDLASLLYTGHVINIEADWGYQFCLEWLREFE